MYGSQYNTDKDKATAREKATRLVLGGDNARTLALASKWLTPAADRAGNHGGNCDHVYGPIALDRHQYSGITLDPQRVPNQS
ncbi:hypothetical protein KSD_19760 [Ktedonobacter sp. SOSP1-85]|nr:hypothetical protein KSD_19760 [Ktedonobacter sp. SOSP1-85]